MEEEYYGQAYCGAGGVGEQIERVASCAAWGVELTDFVVDAEAG